MIMKKCIKLAGLACALAGLACAIVAMHVDKVSAAGDDEYGDEISIKKCFLEIFGWEILCRSFKVKVDKINQEQIDKMQKVINNKNKKIQRLTKIISDMKSTIANKDNKIDTMQKERNNMGGERAQRYRDLIGLQ